MRLLALVLAFVLFWYSINPAPYTSLRREKRDKLPDPKKRMPRPQTREALPSPQFYSLPQLDREEEESASGEDPDDFDWPEFIDG